jgi:hypothetical protein
MSLQIVNANRLEDGRVVYLGPSGWVEQIADAEVAGSDAAASALLDVAKRSVAACEIVDPYLIEVVEEDGRLMPARWRERIRSRGPTVRPDLGYQAQEAR